MSSSSLNLTAVTTALALILAALCGQSHGGGTPLAVGYYKGKCRAVNVDVEAVVNGVVRAWFTYKDNTIAAALLRMQFHDCFVNVSYTL